MDPTSLVVRSQVHGVRFGMYTDEEVRAMSVIEITSPVAFDALGTALPHGLYDPLLGPVESKGNALCPTCSNVYLHCPGHAGHIELCVPAYHPLTFNKLLSLLRIKCLSCHNFRLDKQQTLKFAAKIHLLDLGRYHEALDLEDTLSARIHNAVSKQDGPSTNNQGRKQKKDPLQEDRTTAATNVMRDFLLQQLQIPADPAIVLHAHERVGRKQLVKEFLSDCLKCKKCHNCGAFSPKIRHDAFNKIFQTPLSDKNKRLNTVENIEIFPASSTAQSADRGTSGWDSEDSDMEAEEEKKNSATVFTSDEEEEDDEEDEDDDDPATNVNDILSGRNRQTATSTGTRKKPQGSSRKKGKADEYMHSLEVEAQVRLTWIQEPLVCSKVFGSAHIRPQSSSTDNPDDRHSSPSKPWGIFFLRVISVPPSRFRPPMVLGVMTVEHSQNVYLNKILTLNDKLRTFLAMIQGPNQNSNTSITNLAHSMTLTDKENAQSKAISTWIELQTTVNCFMDSSRDPSATAASEAPNGVRQLLEKKEGIFRKHMMGKRVNFACRSVISPDPYIGTNEIGIPLYFAKVLTYPTPVTSLNVTEMRNLVIRGPRNYPGASWVELPNGQRLELDKMQQQKREALAARLLSSNGIVKVGRQLRNGDMVLMNRQPSLHKPSIMAHRVRILHSPTQKTIRMHYANCDTYNADYDGDEMNCHFPQNDIGRAESEFIVKTDLQFIVPTDGSPLRGLIQDHVDAGVKLTSKDTFLEAWEYQQLIFSCLSSLSGLELVRPDEDIMLFPPAIQKPRALWTGKQVITCLLQHLRVAGDYESSSMGNERLPGICIDRKARTPDYAFGASMEEHLFLIRDGELLRGVLDKNAFGATDLSLVHGVYEAYGPTKAGLLLNALGRLFTFYLQFFSGHSCRMEDLILSTETEKERRALVQRAYNTGSRAAKSWADSDGGKVDTSTLPVINQPLRPFEAATVSARLGELLSGEDGAENAKTFDGYMQSQMNPMASQIIKGCLPNGLAVQFPANTFSLMVLTGAKGSTVNQSQVSCLLGQQALEGRRVPRMSSGRTLPSFSPYDPSPRADGFIVDRFLTGIRPQEYYFHCMAGREGLIDTAVKTSRSGYLQRCLVKHLEELKVAYDHTVRDGEGGVVQFLYGEDGLDVTKARYLESSSTTLQYMARNSKSLERRNMGLPMSSLDIAAADANKVDTLTITSTLTLRKGSFVRARKLRVGTDWTRGKLCRGWFDAIITNVYTDGKSCDIKYIRDGTLAHKVPLEVNFSYAGTQSTRAVSNTCKIIELHAVQDPIISDCSSERGGHRVGSSGSCVSETVAGATDKLLSSDPSVQKAMKDSNLSREDLSRIVANKYAASLCAPGEAVGCIAAQSIGEPSTQMTLNTFHLAGAGANVTLGIPRLREIIMTASKDLKTPSMSIPLHSSVTDREATKLARYFTRLTLFEVIANQRGITVVESLQQSSGGTWERAYQVTLKLHSSERIKEAFGLSLEDIAAIVSNLFIKNLSRIMKMELKRSSADESKSFDVISGDHSDEIYERKQKSSKKSKDYDEDDEDAAGEEDGVVASRFAHKKEMASYGDMDDEEKELVGVMEKEETLQYEDENNDGPFPVTDDEGDIDEDINAFSGVTIDKGSNTLILQPFRVDPSARPLLMVGLVERAAAGTLIRCRSKIDRAFIENEEGRGRCLITMGCNFEELWNLDNVDHGKLSSNDIWAIRSSYGVEAARMSIVNQIRGVFAVYGISIDNRHLSLIADYMTFDGNFKPMNRIGMSDSSSAFLQMSFETTANFMVEAALTERNEPMMSPSANIVMGRPIKHGTGAFECLAQAHAVSLAH